MKLNGRKFKEEEAVQLMRYLEQNIADIFVGLKRVARGIVVLWFSFSLHVYYIDVP